MGSKCVDGCINVDAVPCPVSNVVILANKEQNTVKIQVSPIKQVKDCVPSLYCSSGLDTFSHL